MLKGKQHHGNIKKVAFQTPCLVEDQRKVPAIFGGICSISMGQKCSEHDFDFTTVPKRISDLHI